LISPEPSVLDLAVEAALRVGLVSWSIQQVARLSGVTARTLRYYDEIGLLRPTRIGVNGYRYSETGPTAQRRSPALAKVHPHAHHDLLAAVSKRPTALIDNATTSPQRSSRPFCA
jgi:hypothetical protein